MTVEYLKLIKIDHENNIVQEEPFADVERIFFMSESFGMDRWEEKKPEGWNCF